MLSVSIILLGVFAMAVFLLMNGPLRLIVKLHVFARGPESPRWFTKTTEITSRMVGIIVLLVWLNVYDQGELLNGVWFGLALLCGFLLLLNTPIWLVTRTSAFSRGTEAPARLQTLFIWSSRIIGASAILFTLGLMICLQTALSS